MDEQTGSYFIGGRIDGQVFLGGRTDDKVTDGQTELINYYIDDVYNLLAQFHLL